MSYTRSIRGLNNSWGDTITISMNKIRRNDERARQNYHPGRVMVVVICWECNDEVVVRMVSDKMPNECPSCGSLMIEQSYYWTHSSPDIKESA